MADDTLPGRLLDALDRYTPQFCAVTGGLAIVFGALGGSPLGVGIGVADIAASAWLYRKRTGRKKGVGG